MSDIKNILFSGVGGQGILLASELTAAALLQAGHDVKKSEVHGMAQRGGSVTAQLRYGKKVYSPLIDPGAADIQMAFEMMEAVRYLPYLNMPAARLSSIPRRSCLPRWRPDRPSIRNRCLIDCGSEISR
jgi:indolepyruvate ferredoxin oxidoreductase beta subunit